MDISWINEHIALSGAIENYNALDKVDIVINCRSEQHDDICELTKRGIAYYWIPIVDGDAPTSSQIDVCLSLMNINPDQNILVHCNEGRGRSAVMVIAYFVPFVGSVKNALNFVTERRPAVALRHAQDAKLYEYFDKKAMP